MNEGSSNITSDIVQPQEIRLSDQPQKRSLVQADSLQTTDAPRAKKPRGRPKKDPSLPSAVWDDESVALLFKLRYKSELTSRFESKNNYDKKMAYILLASAMTIALKRSFDSKQVQDKLSKMKADWSMSNPSLPAQTGNDTKGIQPAYFDIMMVVKSRIQRKNLKRRNNGLKLKQSNPALQLSRVA
ncbi:hypothetical protein LEN26_021381 [Aphanomyces euteiches]|nr:hypothetical protein LEN26_021381 [Aphanomyces euteiches]KAH9111491.1 hypothetical protein AeMF1_013999 [Aphanomyces euteiches]KAH9182718.1 hypothetical protein AeNC1_015306 [Aphanomyces euteiches]